MSALIMAWEGHGIRMRMIRVDRAVRLERCYQDALGCESWRIVDGDTMLPIRAIIESLADAFASGKVVVR